MSIHTNGAAIVLGSDSDVVDECELVERSAHQRQPDKSPARRKLEHVSAAIRRARFDLGVLERIKSSYVTPLGAVERVTEAVEDGALDKIIDTIAMHQAIPPDRPIYGHGRGADRLSNGSCVGLPAVRPAATT